MNAQKGDTVMWLKVRYFNTWYKREFSVNVRGNITFKDGDVYFGRYMIPVKHLIAIEPIDD